MYNRLTIVMSSPPDPGVLNSPLKIQIASYAATVLL